VPTTEGSRTRWFSRRSLLLHLAVVVWVPGCGVAAWWQVTIAMSGNELGWLYAVEWPVFAVLGVLGWWQLVHDDPETIADRKLGRRRPATAPAGEVVDDDRPPLAVAAVPALTRDNVDAILRAEDEDEHLAAYNAYLASLAATGHRKTWRDPTGERA
jgi:hypothetical protein